MLVYMESDDDNANMSTYALITSLICYIIVCNNDQWVQVMMIIPTLNTSVNLFII